MEKEQKPRRPRIGETRGSANYEGSSEKYEKVNYSRRNDSDYNFNNRRPYNNENRTNTGYYNRRNDKAITITVIIISITIAREKIISTVTEITDTIATITASVRMETITVLITTRADITETTTTIADRSVPTTRQTKRPTTIQ